MAFIAKGRAWAYDLYMEETFAQKSKKRKLGDLLVETGMITRSQLDHALQIQNQSSKKLGEILTEENIVSQESIIQVLEFQLGIPHISLKTFDISPEATKKISESLAKRHELIPVKISNNSLLVAMSDPMNIYAIDDVRIYSGMEVQPAIALREEIRHFIDIYYGKQEAMKAAEEYKKEYALNLLEKKMDTLEEANSSAPIVKLVNSIIDQAIRTRASDIHIEPFEKYIRIRYRIDGMLEEAMRHENQLLPAIVTRIKISAEMNIAERRKPQDGRISVTVDGRDYDLRISILPTVFGEKVVIRITDKSALLKPKEELGFFDEDMEKYNSILKNPHGMILVTGPTGSGKSTTLYSTLRELNKDNINIVTVEDPVEASIEGINQVQVNPKAGVDFAAALRAILRQDPDIIMIGEIRDGETANIVVKAAVTGHLVVSTLHTNDASSSITRLLDMNIEPFLIGTSVVGVLSQRLVKRLCSKCREKYTPTQSELDFIELDHKENIQLYRSKGCSFCNNSGYMGRIGVYEIMPFTPAIRHLVNRAANADEIKAQAIKDGMCTLKKNGSRLVAQGVTSVEELVRIAYAIE